jgi:hypothetical protein
LLVDGLLKQNLAGFQHHFVDHPHHCKNAAQDRAQVDQKLKDVLIVVCVLH